MKIHRLHLIDVKGVRHREIRFPAQGVIVVEGPNEIGKTSMIEALDLLLEEKDSSRKRQVLAMRPVGRDVPTLIEAELSCGPYRFVYRKQWFRQPATELVVQEPRVEHFTGVEAHERVLAILAETADLPLWKALRLLQATPLSQAELGGSSALSKALDAAAGRAREETTDDSSGAQLMALVEAERARYLTPGRGQPTGDYRLALEAQTAAETRMQAAERAVEDVAADVKRHEQLVEEHDSARHRVEQAQLDLDRLDEEDRAVRVAQEAREQLGRDLAEARRELALAQERHAERLRLTEELAGRLADEDRYGHDVQELRARLGRQEERCAEAARHAADASQQIRHWEECRHRAERVQEHQRRTTELDALRRRIADLEEAVSAHQEAAQARSRHRVDDEILADLERKATAVELATARHTQDAATFTIVGVGPESRLVLDGAEHLLQSGQEHTGQVGVPVEIQLPGQLTVLLRPGAGASQSNAQLEDARTALQLALDDAGVADLEQARASARERRRLDDLCRQMLARRQALAGDQDLERLYGDLQAAEAAMIAEYGDCGEAPEEQPDLAAARDGLAAARTAADQAAAEVETLRRAMEKDRLELARAESLAEVSRREQEQVRNRLETSRQSVPDQLLAQETARAAAHLSTVEEQYGEVLARLESLDEEGTRARLETGRREIAAAEERRQALRDELLSVEARLHQSGRQGRYDELESARSELEEATRQADVLTRRADAVRLLHTTLQAHRSRAKQQYVEPFAAALRKLGEVVHGPGFDVEVDESLTITARIVDGQRIDFEALSTGAKEQMALLTRLAAATLVDPQDGVPVLVDDALGYTDPGRLRRMAEVFTHVSEQAQVILLTCTPSRYDGIAGAHVLRVSSDPVVGQAAAAGEARA